MVSHDRYFLERTVDTVWALLDDGQISMLPRGVDEYLERRAQALHLAESALLTRSSRRRRRGATASTRRRRGSAEEREARKAVARIDRQLERVGVREAELNAAILDAGQDYERLAELSAELQRGRRRAGRARAGVARGRRARSSSQRCVSRANGASSRRSSPASVLLVGGRAGRRAAPSRPRSAR